MKQLNTQRLERTILSQQVGNYSEQELRNIFGRLSDPALQQWMDHFIEKEEYEVCQIIKEIINETNQ